MAAPAHNDEGARPRDLDAAEQALCSGEQRLHEILQTAPLAYVTLDEEGLIVDWNYGAELMFGFARPDAVGCNFAELVLPESVRDGYTHHIASLAGESPELSGSFEVSAARRDGTQFMADMKIAAVPATEGRMFDVFVTDFTERWEAEQDRRVAEAELAYHARHDRLTGLPNRTRLVERLTRALTHARREHTVVALICGDVDQFKLVNDTFGHQAGDDLLVQVVNRIKQSLRASDLLARVDPDDMARLDGDHLAVVCEQLSDERTAVAVADRIRSVVAEPFLIGGERVFVKMSIGIALSTTSENAAAIVHNAETAMYRAKALGGDRSEVFDVATRERLLARVRREGELHDAIQHEQLRLEFQPIVALRDARITGVEALVRWQHPEHGWLPPAQFIDIAEQSGLIVPLGEWVLRTAARQLTEWGTVPTRVFVNVSPRQLDDVNLVGVVDEVLRAFSLAPSRLVLEITENSLVDDGQGRISTLHELHRLGVRLALDDFGVGYSALGYLRSLPFHCLKLDRSFIAGLGNNAADVQIAGAVIAMAQALRMTVIAEGVENQAQLTCLERLNCHLAQGFHFSEPLPAEELTLLLRDGSWNGSLGGHTTPALQPG